jgi:hypothetical protein
MFAKNKLVKYTGLATAAFLASFGLALAQSATPASDVDATGPSAAPAPTSAATINATTNGKPNVTSNLTTGWYYVHATHCIVYPNGYFYVYPQEGGWWATNYTPFLNTLEPECALGNWIAFYVYDTVGDWNEIYTYDYK